MIVYRPWKPQEKFSKINLRESTFLIHIGPEFLYGYISLSRLSSKIQSCFLMSNQPHSASIYGFLRTINCKLSVLIVTESKKHLKPHSGGRARIHGRTCFRIQDNSQNGHFGCPSGSVRAFWDPKKIITPNSKITFMVLVVKAILLPIGIFM